MKKAYIAKNPNEAHFLVGLLEERGIQAVVQGEHLLSLHGEIPCTTYPEVWVVRHEELERARSVIQNEYERKKGGQNLKPAWICPKCSETIEGQFTECWNCLTSRPESMAAPDEDKEEVVTAISEMAKRRSIVQKIGRAHV